MPTTPIIQLQAISLVVRAVLNADRLATGIPVLDRFATGLDQWFIVQSLTCVDQSFMITRQMLLQCVLQRQYKRIAHFDIRAPREEYESTAWQHVASI